MENDRIQLTPPSIDELDAMYEVIDRNRQSLQRFLPWVTPSFAKQDLLNNTEQARQDYDQFSGEFWFNILAKSTGKYLGAIGFIIRDKNVPYFEIGYWLDPDCEGKGIISDAIALVESFAFETHGAKRVEIKMAATNRKSTAVAERCGYLFEARLMNARVLPSGVVDDTLIYAKTSS